MDLPNVLLNQKSYIQAHDLVNAFPEDFKEGNLNLGRF